MARIMTMFVIPIQMVSERCDQDDGWVYSRWTEHCYKFFDHQDSNFGSNGLTHSEASASCQYEGGDLASVNSIEELAFIQTNILE